MLAALAGYALRRSQNDDLLQRLHSDLAEGPVCADRWATRYPLELEQWQGHSCAWKKRWGQCAQFAEKCALTCGACTPASADGAVVSIPETLTGPSTGDGAAEPAAASLTQQIVTEVDDGGVADDGKPDPDNELLAADAISTTIDASSPRTEQPEFVGGARDQSAVLERVRHHRRRRGKAPRQPRKRDVEQSRSSDDAPERVFDPDASYEGPH